MGLEFINSKDKGRWWSLKYYSFMEIMNFFGYLSFGFVYLFNLNIGLYFRLIVLNIYILF